MNIKLEYPIYLCRHEGGFASIGHEMLEDGEFKSFAIVAFSSQENHDQFVAVAEIEGETLSVDSEQELVRFLRKLQAPFTALAFNPSVDDNGVHTDWTLDVATLMEEHLPSALSPWDYPLYAPYGDDDWLMVEGTLADGEAINLLCLFSTQEIANSYAEGAEEDVQLQPLETPEALKLLLRGLQPLVTGVAFDAAITDEGTLIAGTCMMSDDILEKYVP